MLSFSKIWKKEDRSYKFEYSDSFILMLILFKWGSFGWGESLNVMGIKGGVNVFRIRMNLKTLKTQAVPVYFGGSVPNYIPWTSTEIFVSQRYWFL